MRESSGRRSSAALPALLRRMNEWRVIEALARHGAASRAELTRLTGISAPTVSKAVDTLVKRGLIEPREPQGVRAGRPAPLYTLASEAAQVIGVAVRPDRCHAAASGVDTRDGHRHGRTFATPGSSAELIDAVEAHVSEIAGLDGRRLLGVGVSVPGRVGPRDGAVHRCWALDELAGVDLAGELAGRLGVDVRVTSQCHGLCLAEWWFDPCGTSDHFVVIDTSDAIVARLYSSGRAVISPVGGCGAIGRLPLGVRRGENGNGDRLDGPMTLDDVATDAAFARAVAQRIGGEPTPDEAAAAVCARPDDFADLLDETADHLAAAITAAVRLYRPECIRIYGHQCTPVLMERVDRRVDHDLPHGVCGANATVMHAPLAAIVDRLTRDGDPDADD